MDHRSEVERWKAIGTVYLWKYKGDPKDFSGWHIVADRAGALSCIDLFARMQRELAPCKRTFEVHSPSIDILRVSSRPTS